MTYEFPVSSCRARQQNQAFPQSSALQKMALESAWRAAKPHHLQTHQRGCAHGTDGKDQDTAESVTILTASPLAHETMHVAPAHRDVGARAHHDRRPSVAVREVEGPAAGLDPMMPADAATITGDVAPPMLEIAGAGYVRHEGGCNRGAVAAAELSPKARRAGHTAASDKALEFVQRWASLGWSGS
jgi:hypothetical protein